MQESSVLAKNRVKEYSDPPSLVRSLPIFRFLLHPSLASAIGVLTGLATLTGYTAIDLRPGKHLANSTKQSEAKPAQDRPSIMGDCLSFGKEIRDRLTAASKIHRLAVPMAITFPDSSKQSWFSRERQRSKNRKMAKQKGTTSFQALPRNKTRKGERFGRAKIKEGKHLRVNNQP